MPYMLEIRQMDDLGRIIIPRGMRVAMGLSDNDFLELRYESGLITLQKPVPQPSEIDASSLD